MKILALLLLLFYSSCQSEKHKEEKAFDAVDKMEIAFLNSDSNYIIRAIDTLKTLDSFELINQASTISSITGFGWCRIDAYNPREYYDTTESRILKQNIIAGLEVYRNSDLFMKKISPLAACLYFPYSSEERLRESTLSGLKRFLDDIADSSIVIVSQN